MNTSSSLSVISVFAICFASPSTALSQTMIQDESTLYQPPNVAEATLYDEYPANVNEDTNINYYYDDDLEYSDPLQERALREWERDVGIKVGDPERGSGTADDPFQRAYFDGDNISVIIHEFRWKTENTESSGRKIKERITLTVSYELIYASNRPEAHYVDQSTNTHTERFSKLLTYHLSGNPHIREVTKQSFNKYCDPGCQTTLDSKEHNHITTDDQGIARRTRWLNDWGYGDDGWDLTISDRCFLFIPCGVSISGLLYGPRWLLKPGESKPFNHNTTWEQYMDWFVPEYVDHVELRIQSLLREWDYF